MCTLFLTSQITSVNKVDGVTQSIVATNYSCTGRVILRECLDSSFHVGKNTKKNTKKDKDEVELSNGDESIICFFRRLTKSSKLPAAVKKLAQESLNFESDSELSDSESAQ